jgi:hypothetical protein
MLYFAMLIIIAAAVVILAGVVIVHGHPNQLIGFDTTSILFCNLKMHTGHV